MTAPSPAGQAPSVGMQGPDTKQFGPVILSKAEYDKLVLAAKLVATSPTPSAGMRTDASEHDPLLLTAYRANDLSKQHPAVRALASSPQAPAPGAAPTHINGIPQFNPNATCSLVPGGNPLATQCPRCNNPHHACDRGAPGAAQPAPSGEPVAQGDYVLATKYGDGDPGDMWALGFYDCERDGRHYVKDSAGRQIRGNGFRRVARVRVDVGNWLLNVVAKQLERCPAGTVNLWSMLTDNAFDLEADRAAPIPPQAAPAQPREHQEHPASGLRGEARGDGTLALPGDASRLLKAAWAVVQRNQRNSLAAGNGLLLCDDVYPLLEELEKAVLEAMATRIVASPVEPREVQMLSDEQRDLLRRRWGSTIDAVDATVEMFCEVNGLKLATPGEGRAQPAPAQVTDGVAVVSPPAHPQRNEPTKDTQ